MSVRSLLLSALIACSLPVWAEGFYGVGEITHSSTSLDSTYFNNQLSSNGSPAVSSNSSGSGAQWRLQLGYQFNDTFSIEGGYIDFGKAKYSANYGSGNAQGTLKAGGVDVAGLVSLPLNDQLSVFGKLGLAAAQVKSSLSTDTLGNFDSKKTMVRPLVGIGAVYKLNASWDLRGDLDSVRDLGKNDTTGKMSTTMFSLGTVYHF